MFFSVIPTIDMFDFFFPKLIWKYTEYSFWALAVRTHTAIILYHFSGNKMKINIPCQSCSKSFLCKARLLGNKIETDVSLTEYLRGSWTKLLWWPFSTLDLILLWP